jgi:parallel beta-helix repeat protein
MLSCLLVALAFGPAQAASPTPEIGSDGPQRAVEPESCGSLQKLIDAAPTGSTLTVPACTYRESIVIDRPLTVEGYGATISGQNEQGATVRDSWVTVVASDVTVAGFTMRDAANAPQTGAVAVEPGASRFTLLDCDLAGAAGANVSIGVANDSRVEGCDIHHAGQIGVHIGGDGTNGRGNVIANNLIRDNNTLHFDPEWEAGGLKATDQTGLILEGNTVRDNAGPGLWCDIYCEDIIVTDNTINDNTHAGIMFEVSTGASITDNRVWGNGWGKSGPGWGAGILISSSGGARVVGNTVAWNNAGISVISQDRQDWDHSARDNEVADNVVVGETGSPLVVWRQDWDGILFRPDSGNRGSGDAYWSGGGPRARVFEWQGTTKTHQAFASTRVGQDSTLLDTEEMKATLAAAEVWCCPPEVNGG